MLVEPFNPEFFFCSTSFKNLLDWVGKSVIPNGGLHLVRSEIGSGISTAFQQIASSAGTDKQAINVESIHWTNQPISDVVDGAIDRFACKLPASSSSGKPIAKLWLLHAFRPSQVTALRNRLARVPELLTDVSVVIRIEDNPSTRGALDELPTLSFPRISQSEFARCVERSIQFAGATRTIFQPAAIERVVRMSKGSFSELASATNRALAWGHSQGLLEISSQAVCECFGTEIQGRRTIDATTYRYAG